MSSRFSLDMRKWINGGIANSDAVVRKVILDFGTRLVERSPVGDGTLWKRPPPKGYVGGRFRANWQYGNLAGAGLPSGELPDIDATGRASTERLAAGVAGAARMATKHYLVNNLPYAIRLETGWSKQAPAGMVAITVAEFQPIIDKAATEVKNGVV